MTSLGNVRKKALLKLQSPDQLDDRVQVVNRWSWLALGALGVLLAGVVVWSAISTLPTDVKGSGFVVPSAGWTGVQATASGVVASMVAADAKVHAGQVVARIRDQSTSRVILVRASASGVVAEANVANGQFVRAGDQLAIISPSSSDLVVYAYFPIDSASSIAPKSATNVALDGTPSSAFGFVRGHVRSVGALAATNERLQQVLLNSALAQQVSRHGPVVEVVIALDPARTPSGYRWTVGSGPSFRPVNGGVPVHVSIVTDRKHPISYVF